MGTEIKAVRAEEKVLGGRRDAEAAREPDSETAFNLHIKWEREMRAAKSLGWFLCCCECVCVFLCTCVFMTTDTCMCVSRQRADYNNKEEAVGKDVAAPFSPCTAWIRKQPQHN